MRAREGPWVAKIGIGSGSLRLNAFPEVSRGTGAAQVLRRGLGHGSRLDSPKGVGAREPLRLSERSCAMDAAQAGRSRGEVAELFAPMRTAGIVRVEERGSR